MTEGALQAAVTMLPILCGGYGSLGMVPPIRKAVPVAVSSDLCVVGASETDVAVPLNSPKTPLQTSSTTLFTPSSSGSPAPTADPAPPSPVWARSWRGFNTVDE